MNKLTKWLQAHRQRAKERRLKELQSTAESRFQVREWRGELYFSLDDDPLMKCQGHDINKTLTELRTNYINYNHGKGNNQRL